MYIPTKAIMSKDITVPRIMLLLMGPPGTGKSYSALTTFPNPVLAAFEPPPEDKVIKDLNIPILPFYDPKWVEEKFEKTEDNKPLNIKKPYDAYKFFIERGEALKLEKDQTLITDNLTSMMDIWTINKEREIPMKDGKPNDYWIWGKKIEFLRDVHVALHKLQCNLVTICHEAKEKDDTPARKVTGKKIPYLSGAYKDIVGNKYNNIFKTGVMEVSGKPSYYWQVWPDDEYDLRCTFRSEKKLVKPTYQNFIDNEKV